MEAKKMNGGKIALRVAVCVITALLLVIFAVYGVMWILVHGPSTTARRLFVLSVKETSAGGFLADIYLNENEIAEILQTGEDKSGSEMDSSLISIPTKPETPTPGSPADSSESLLDPDDSSHGKPDTAVTPPDDTNEADDGIQVIDIKGQTFHGKMMIITDSTRVFVGVPDSYGADSSGLTVAAMIEKYDCIAGTNAGGFYDPNGQGTGGIPDGMVIYEGELLWGDPNASFSIAGLDSNGLLHVGQMTGHQALEANIRYAASFGPALVVNGEAAGGKWGLGGGLNPRTAIGQRADGAILLLVINGRSIDSLGATLDDLSAIMLEHGAINATNLDGGSSSIMIMDGEYLTNSAYIFGERVVATAILVRKNEE